MILIMACLQSASVGFSEMIWAFPSKIMMKIHFASIALSCGFGSGGVGVLLHPHFGMDIRTFLFFLPSDFAFPAFPQGAFAFDFALVVFLLVLSFGRRLFS
ncbi:hypothetical protein [Pseudomonas sp. NPDC088444]|uniref:hypothetical protein n=1 Tax=Pseudomonas sp. NPDC088444 TaxID=3364456 RepID=UPI00384A9E01